MKQFIFVIITSLIFVQELRGQELPLTTVVNALDGKSFKTRAANFRTVFHKTTAGAFELGVTESEHTTPGQLFALEGYLNDAGKPPHTYFHVLRMFYGFDVAHDALKLIYLPDNAQNAGGLRFTFDLGEYTGFAANQTVYLLNVAGDFVPTNWGTPGTLNSPAYMVEQYRTHILINRFGVPGLPHASYNPLTINSANERSDAEGIAFSFQELHAFLAGADVYITHVPIIADFNGLNTYKHDVAVSWLDPAQPVAADDHTKMVADLGSLCPTVCGEVTLKRILPGLDPSMTHTLIFLKGARLNFSEAINAGNDNERNDSGGVNRSGDYGLSKGMIVWAIIIGIILLALGFAIGGKWKW